MHSLSGAVLEPRALKELIDAEEFASLQTPQGVLNTPVEKDEIYFLANSTSGKIPLPVIGEQNNHGNYIISLGNLVKYLGEKAESMGVEIYPGYPAAEVPFLSFET
jgi:electron-transferring-flavoprotein dehydrogenase